MKKVLLSLAAASMLFAGGNVVASASDSAAPTTQYISDVQSRYPYTGYSRVQYNNVRFWNTPGGTALGQVHQGTYVRFLGTTGIRHNGNWYSHVTIQSGAGSNGNAGRSGWIRSDYLGPN